MTSSVKKVRTTNEKPQEAHCLKCKQVQPLTDYETVTTKNNRTQVRGTCSVCGKKVTTFCPSPAGAAVAPPKKKVIVSKVVEEEEPAVVEDSGVAKRKVKNSKVTRPLPEA